MNTIERINGFHPPAIPADSIESILRRAIGDVMGEGMSVTINVFVNAVPTAKVQSPIAPPIADKPLREIDKNLLEAASDEPVSGKQLIVLAGYKSNSYSRGAIRKLVDAGLLQHVTGGYRKAAPK